MRQYASFDLHSNNAVGVVINENKEWVFKRKFKNELPPILSALEKYRQDIVGVVVESTYNWYWLVDGLMKNNYKVHLAHITESDRKRNKKYTDDYRDAFNLADKLRQGELAQGYIYPEAERPLRDLARKRAMLVRNRSQHLISLGNFFNRHLGIQRKANDIKRMKAEDLKNLLPDKRLQLSAQSNLSIIQALDRQITILEKEILAKGKLKKEFQVLLTVPGIGDTLGLAISLEIGDIKRFKKPGNYVSYCRCAPSKWSSNDKKKGEGNRKNGNKHLSWSYIEAANFTIRSCPYARAYYQKKLKKVSKRIIALKAVAAKLARATYYMLTDDIKYDPEKLFGMLKTPRNTNKGRDSKTVKGLDTKPTA